MLFDEFCTWAKRKRIALEQNKTEAVLTITYYGEDEESARLDLSHATKVGRIALSATGNCDIEIMDQPSGENRFYEYRSFDGKKENVDFDKEFLDYFKIFDS